MDHIERKLAQDLIKENRTLRKQVVNLKSKLRTQRKRNTQLSKQNNIFVQMAFIARSVMDCSEYEIDQAKERFRESWDKVAKRLSEI